MQVAHNAGDPDDEERPDLDAIEARYEATDFYRGARQTFPATLVDVSLADVPVLVAECRRLRSLLGIVR